MLTFFWAMSGVLLVMNKSDIWRQNTFLAYSIDLTDWQQEQEICYFLVYLDSILIHYLLSLVLL